MFSRFRAWLYAPALHPQPDEYFDPKSVRLVYEGSTGRVVQVIVEAYDDETLAGGGTDIYDVSHHKRGRSF